MADDFWRRLETLYHAAAARPRSERGAFIRSACGTDEALLRELESLFADRSADGFLDAAVFDPSPANSKSPTVDAASEDGGNATGTLIGVYRIVGRLDSGGMGDVYRARDTRLGRDVAIKILPREFTTDNARLARFEREARVLASLNHPNIGAIYGIEDAAIGAHGGPALVLELVEGETLAEHIARRRMAVVDVLRVAIQIADALEAAHDKGIVHRDLKPANIKLSPEGTAKVLDFGLAMEASLAEPSDDAEAPTIERTSVGSILGTVPYMSPEQARGEVVDKRTDVWAFGCVLYEMLTGRRAFSGETTHDTLAQILHDEVDWSQLPDHTPDPVRRLLRRMLVKAPRQRLRDIGDARLELQEAAEGGTPEGSSHATGSSRRLTWTLAGWATAVVLAAALLVLRGSVTNRVPPSSQPLALVSIPVGRDESYARDIAVSPDGAYIAYIAGPPGDHKTYLRSLAQRQARAVTEVPAEISYPFFSPDSQWLAFFDAGKLKKVSVGGGAPITLADAPAARGGAWAADGMIVFAPAARSGLYMVPDAGGKAEPFTTLDESAGETSHRQPSWITGTETIVYTAEGDTYAKRRVLATSIVTRKTRVLLASNAEHVKYAPSGHLTFLDSRKLVAAPFDVDSLTITGPSRTVLDNVGTFGFSSSGMLVFGRSDAAASGSDVCTVVWVDRDGREQVVRSQPRGYLHPRLSPDGGRLVVQIVSGTDRGVWMYDLRRDLAARFTFEGSYSWPLWTPDGRRVIFGINNPGTQWDIQEKAADGSGSPQNVLSRPLTQIPRAITPDGTHIVFTQTDPTGGDTLWSASMQGESAPQPLLDQTPGEMMPSFSPNGRWLAYVSHVSGRNEVYVRGMAGASGQWQISQNGGVEPMWSPTGRELFYRSKDTMLAVDVTMTPTFALGKEHPLFTGSYVFGTTEAQQYDVALDGRRFVMLKPQTNPREAEPLDAIVNWFDELRRNVTAGTPSVAQRSGPDVTDFAMAR